MSWRIEALQKSAKHLTTIHELAKKLATQEEREAAAAQLKEDGCETVSPYVILFSRLKGSLEGLPMVEELVKDLAAELELLERLEKVMETFEVFANRTDPRNEKELSLLEKLVADQAYKYERRVLYSAIQTALGAVEEGEIEAEYERATKALEAAGFAAIENEDFQGWERAAGYHCLGCGLERTMIGEQCPGCRSTSLQGHQTERISIEISRPSRKTKPFGYVFSYAQGERVVDGHSGEFSKLLEAAGIPGGAK